MGWAPREPGRLRPAGTGKTFSSKRSAESHRSRHAGGLVHLEQIGVLVRAHRADDSLGKAVAKIVRAELVVVDDVGLSSRRR